MPEHLDYVYIKIHGRLCKKTALNKNLPVISIFSFCCGDRHTVKNDNYINTSHYDQTLLCADITHRRSVRKD